MILPNIKSAKKRVLVNKTKNERNRAAKTAMKTQLKKFDSAIQQGTGIQAVALLHVQFHDLSVGFRRYQDLGCLKGTGSVKIIVCITASRP